MPNSRRRSDRRLRRQPKGCLQESERLATLRRITDAYADNLSAQREVLAQQRQTYKEEDELRSNWLAGAKQGWADYVDDATNAYSAVKALRVTR